MDRYLMGENVPPCTLDLRHDFESPCMNISHSVTASAQGVHALEAVSTVSPETHGACQALGQVLPLELQRPERLGFAPDGWQGLLIT